ncbi:MAG: hypothetical protein PHC92_09425 [Syntrophomonadaceae bacterium]|nr:hypothetical protein [Syntrophomonadaceae bacterium]MDD3023871.1 hypothetical protein [Syntrophomonadaceae bacterium]
MAKRFIIWTFYTFIIALTVSLLIIIIGPVIYWNKMPEKPLNIWIVDKTVPVPDYREHKGLMWILNYNKIISAESNEDFHYDQDYFGFFPQADGKYDNRELANAKEEPDLIYLADTYGVYNGDYMFSKVKDGKDLIYGGLSTDEINSIKANIGNGNTIIGEYNIAAAPTNLENRRELEKIFGLRWLGWKGLYYKELSRDLEIPEQVVENYEEQQKQRWSFAGEGYVLISDNDEVVVLESKKHFGNKGLQIIFNEPFSSEFNVSKTAGYYNWFEFVKPQPGVETIANYKLDLTDQGKKLFAELGLAAQFAAIVRNENVQYKSYYFAGDFADIQNISKIKKFIGFDRIKKITSSINKRTQDYFFWNAYVPMMNKIISNVNYVAENKQLQRPGTKDIAINVKAEKDGFQIIENGKWKKLFIKGVNIGAALPGKWFTEFPDDEEIYLNWFEKIGQMNANTIRIYTLLPPEFYNALQFYNSKHPDDKLWLLQEIWPEENPLEHNYLRTGYIEEYYQEIEYVLDAIHGKANIAARKGRAYGIYNRDVSQYVLGYLVGRELEPDEVIATNLLNKGYSFKGKYLSSANNATPTEGWLAMNCDYVMEYEENNYFSQHPVAIVSWPTLDVQEHDSEWNSSGLKLLEFNDKVSVDINNINTEARTKAGFFGAYHIYPNYPDFMNNEAKYNNYQDEQGRLRYGGYLQEFIVGHQKYPALVAEFGMATGMGNAHSSPDGLNHGGVTEKEQGNGIVRMMKSIQKEGYAGAIIFEWLDEWAKKTWITEPFMIPYDRHVFWHNAGDPEQNYGLLAMESQYIRNQANLTSGNGAIKSILLNHDSTFLYIDMVLNKKPDFKQEKLYIGLDTYSRDKGELKFDPAINIQAPSGLEFLLLLNGNDNSKILVHPGYNIANNRFSSYSSSNGIFEEMKPLINKERITKTGQRIAAVYQEGSKLNYGKLSSNTYNHWYMEGNLIHIRIPWNKINITDPSSLMVLEDNSNPGEISRDTLKTVKTDGIIVSALWFDLKNKEKIDTLNSQKPYIWQGWDVPLYKERLKESYSIIQDYFSKI